MARPKTVMRFYGNLDYAIQTIAFKEITFLHSDRMNDPFDPYFYFITDFNASYSKLTDFVQQRYPEDFPCFEALLPKNNWNEVIGTLEDHFKAYLKGSFLFSTCAVSKDNHPKDNLYMWSHYGNGHRGVAFEFDTELLSSSVLDKHVKLGNRDVNIDEVLFKVNYAKEVPKITCDSIFKFIMNDTKESDETNWLKTDLAHIMRLVVTSKSAEWEIEDEWRLMWQNDETKVNLQRVKMRNSSVVSIYLGCLIDANAKENLVSETRKNFPNVKIFEGKKAKGEFALEFDQLVDQEE